MERFDSGAPGREPAGEVFGLTDALYDAAFSRDGSVFASTGVAGTVEWWDARRRVKFAQNKLGVRDEGVALTFTGPRLASVLTRVRHMLRCTPQGCVIADRRKPVVSASGLQSATFGPDAGYWFEWRERPYRCTIRECEPLPGPAHSGQHAEAVSPDGQHWAVRGWDAGAGVISFCTARGCHRLDTGVRGSSSWIGGLRFDPTGLVLVAGTGDGRVLFFDGRTGARLGPRWCRLTPAASSILPLPQMER